MKDIIKVGLVLENCESISLNPSDLAIFNLNKIDTYISRIACNSISKEMVANDILMVVCKKANIQYNSFSETNKNKIFDRLSHWNDITSIDIYYEDGTAENYLVDWESEDEHDTCNKNQISLITPKGNLIISIKNGDDIRHYDNTEYYDKQCDIDWD